MDCKSARKLIDEAFDDDFPFSLGVKHHLASCGPCAAYEQRLQAFDAQLRLGPEPVPAPDLVAKIQATIANEPAELKVPWSHVAAAFLSVAALTGAGWFVDTGRILSRANWSQWLPAGPLLPDWQVVRWESAGILVAARNLLQVAFTGMTDLWSLVAASISGVLGVDARWLWPTFTACLVFAVALNLFEALRRRGNDQMHLD